MSPSRTVISIFLPSTFLIIFYHKPFTKTFTRILLLLVVIQQGSWDLFKFQSLFPLKQGCNQVFVGCREGGQKHHRLVFIIEFYINPQQATNNFIECVDVLSQIRTLCHLSSYSFRLRLSLFVRELDIYRLSNFNHITTVDMSSMTSYISSSARHSRIVLTAFILSSSHSIDHHLGFLCFPVQSLHQTLLYQ